MLIRYFRKLNTLTPILLFLTGGVLWAEVWFMQDPVFFPPVASSGPLFRMMIPAFSSFPQLSWFAAFAFLFLQAILINHIVTTHGIVERHSFLTSLVYMMLMSVSEGLLCMNPVLFSNFFMLLALNKVFKIYSEEGQTVEVFNVGMLIGIAGMFYSPAWVFLLLLIISLFIFYLIDLRSLSAAVMGFLFPFVFFGLYLFVADLPLSLAERFEITWGWPWNSFRQLFVVGKLLAGFIAALSALSVFHLLAISIPDKPIRLRKRLRVLVYFFFVAVLAMFFTGGMAPFHIGLLFIPVSILLAGFFHQIDRMVIAEVLFTVLTGLIIAGKVIALAGFLTL